MHRIRAWVVTELELLKLASIRTRKRERERDSGALRISSPHPSFVYSRFPAGEPGGESRDNVIVYDETRRCLFTSLLSRVHRRCADNGRMKKSDTLAGIDESAATSDNESLGSRLELEEVASKRPQTIKRTRERERETLIIARV